MLLAHRTRPISLPLSDLQQLLYFYGKQWRTPTETLAHVIFPGDFGTAFQKGSGPELVSFAKANYARKDMDTRFVLGGAIMCAGVCAGFQGRRNPSSVRRLIWIEERICSHGRPWLRRLSCGISGVPFTVCQVSQLEKYHGAIE